MSMIQYYAQSQLRMETAETTCLCPCGNHINSILLLISRIPKKKTQLTWLLDERWKYSRLCISQYMQTLLLGRLLVLLITVIITCHRSKKPTRGLHPDIKVILFSNVWIITCTRNTYIFIYAHERNYYLLLLLIRYHLHTRIGHEWILAQHTYMFK